MEVVLSNISSPEVLSLFSEHDDFLTAFLGDDGVYYTRYSANENITGAWVAYCDDVSVGCAAYRVKSPGVGEIKRMFIRSEYRGQGTSKLLLFAVEEYARGHGNHTLHLSTRITLEPAVTLYRRSGFVETFRSGLYIEMEKKL